ncbi:general stress protein [Microbacterium sp. M3]|uniref:General stress protein n=1 Tax=Microbacterium arthrosphaerae TaxID=792652 RepID=A0ABU4H149_9MICO|nr:MULTISPECIES: general stress protein [Microbacterium]MDW4573046.1 general stress protein [Microbacterium arthrosphaerae]MDW7606901.1 general stress protein [Microbacterium sp. M3]
MTMMGGRASHGSDAVGPTVASFPTYEAAQKAVSSLIAADVPARDIAIVGQGLRSIERITGRLGYAAAARSGAINGILLGLLFSAILVIGSPSVPIQAFVGVLFVGIAIGMLMSIIAYSFVRRRRDYASVMQVVADHYEITVSDTSAGRARQVLGSSPSAPPPAAPTRPTASEAVTSAPSVAEPPKYGERLPPKPDAVDDASSPAPAPAPAVEDPAPSATVATASGESAPASGEAPPARAGDAPGSDESDRA